MYRLRLLLFVILLLVPFNLSKYVKVIHVLNNDILPEGICCNFAVSITLVNNVCVQPF